MKTIEINEWKYEIIENNKGALDIDELKEKMTEYFDTFDYIVGDWAYGKLRLKGFNEKNNKNYNEINNYENVEKYIKEYCAYGCKYFIIRRINVDKQSNI